MGQAAQARFEKHPAWAERTAGIVELPTSLT
jgi:hypothetical protein